MKWLKTILGLDKQYKPHLSKEMVLTIVKTEAEKKRWCLKDPLISLRSSKNGSYVWEVWINSGCIDGKARICIDDQTGEVLKMWSLPR